MVEHDDPASVIVCDRFLPDAVADRVLQGIIDAEDSFDQGLVLDRGFEVKSDHKANRVLILQRPKRRSSRPATDSPMETIFDPLKDALLHPDFGRLTALSRSGLFHLLAQADFDDLQVSCYRDGDHYGRHRDVGGDLNITALLLLARRPVRFSGGDLVFEHRGAQRRIRFRHNRLLLFPSSVIHRVTPVRLECGAFADSRFSLQVWLNHRDARTATRPAPTETAASGTATAALRFLPSVIAIPALALQALGGEQRRAGEALGESTVRRAFEAMQDASSWLRLIVADSLRAHRWVAAGEVGVIHSTDEPTSVDFSIPLSGGRSRRGALTVRFRQESHGPVVQIRLALGAGPQRTHTFAVTPSVKDVVTIVNAWMDENE
jgi:hypothetical protein